ncbi:MAG: hypothetical protein KAI66_23350 [Lentisphaeria bacterium]|nr:hypothetical protein [Lentisphaeria bacterium]
MSLEELVRKGDTLYAAFDNRKALVYYQKAWELAPQDAELLTKLTWTCNNVGEDLDSKASEPYFSLAIVYAEKLKKLAPKSSLTWFLSAIVNGNLGLHRGGKQKVTLSRHVAEDAKKAIALDPNFSPGYVVLGVYYREVATLNWALRMAAKHLLGGLPSGTLKQAEQMLLTGIKKEPGNVYAHYQLAITYEVMKKPKKAVTYYRNVVRLPVVDHQDPVFKKKSKARISELE